MESPIEPKELCEAEAAAKVRVHGEERTEVKIYTKAGDEGETGLLGGARVSKADHRIDLLGRCDVVNSALGLARALDPETKLDVPLHRIQCLLFELGSELANPPESKFEITSIKSEDIEELESEIDGWESDLKPLKSFILPGGTVHSAQLHVARTECRAFERVLSSLASELKIRPELLQFVNRLSDWLFVAARWANQQAGIADVPWKSREKS